eukprot:899305_1
MAFLFLCAGLMLHIPVLFADPICVKPTLPFNTESAQQYAEYTANCLYLWFQESSTYKGPKGFKQLWGPSGYRMTKDTITSFDGKPIPGYNGNRAK